MTYDQNEFGTKLESFTYNLPVCIKSILSIYKIIFKQYVIIFNKL